MDQQPATLQVPSSSNSSTEEAPELEALASSVAQHPHMFLINEIIHQFNTGEIGANEADRFLTKELYYTQVENNKVISSMEANDNQLIRNHCDIYDITEFLAARKEDIALLKKWRTETDQATAKRLEILQELAKIRERIDINKVLIDQAIAANPEVSTLNVNQTSRDPVLIQRRTRLLGDLKQNIEVLLEKNAQLKEANREYTMSGQMEGAAQQIKVVLRAAQEVEAMVEVRLPKVQYMKNKLAGDS